MSNDTKASGNFNFDNNKNVAKTDYSTKNLKKVNSFFWGRVYNKITKKFL